MTTVLKLLSATILRVVSHAHAWLATVEMEHFVKVYTLYIWLSDLARQILMFNLDIDTCWGNAQCINTPGRKLCARRTNAHCFKQMCTVEPHLMDTPL